MYLLNIVGIFLIVYVGYIVIKNIDTTKVYDFSPIPEKSILIVLGLAFISTIIVYFILGSIETNKENKTIK